MNEVKFLKKDAIRFGWATATGNIGFFIVMLIILVSAAILPQGIAGAFGKARLLAFIILVAGAVIQMELRLGLIKTLITFADGKKPAVVELFSCFDKRIVTVFVAGLLYGIMTFLGTLLLIVPGIILGIKFMFFSYFIVDKNAGIIESLEKSAELTKGFQDQHLPSRSAFVAHQRRRSALSGDRAYHNDASFNDSGGLCLQEAPCPGAAGCDGDRAFPRR